MIIKIIKSRLAFTFIELIAVVAIVASLFVIVVGLLNPLKQIQKSWDGKRKAELGTLAKIFEDFYNDKNRFPRAQDICFDSPSAPRTDLYGKTACFCQICGRSPTSPNLSPYLPSLPCDPQSTQKEYLYDFDCSQSPQNPQWFRIYTKLSLTDDPDIKRVGCGAGCGPLPDLAYNYLVFSNAQPEAILCSDYLRLYQKDQQGLCNICKSPSGGDVCNYDQDVYNEVTCSQKCGS